MNDLDPNSLYDNLPIPIYLCDENGYITYSNKATDKLWGKTIEPGTQKWWGAGKIYTTSGKLITAEETAPARLFKYKEPIDSQEVISQSSTGELKNVIIYPVVSFDDQGKAIGTVNTVVDVTAYKGDEPKRSMLAAIIESSEDAIISKTLDGIITSWNQSAEKLFGYTEAEAIGKPITLIIPEDRLQEEAHIISQIKQGNKVDHLETYRLHKSGHLIHISVTISPVKNESGMVIGASKIARDISERIKAEERQAMLAAIVDTSEDVIISKTLDGIITSWNGAAETLFGHTAEEAVGKHISLIIPVNRLNEEEMIISNIRQGNRISHFETIRITKYGQEVPISVSVSPIMSTSGEIIGASKIARDIRSQREAQLRLERYAENLEILNEVSRSVSEDLDTQGILQKVTDATTQLTGAAYGAFLYNHKDKKQVVTELYALAGASKEEFEKNRFLLNTPLFKTTLIDNSIVRSNDITRDIRFTNTLPNEINSGNFNIKGYLAVPITTKTGGVIGGLFFADPEPDKFTLEHEKLVEGIAAHASLALDNAKLYEEIKELNSKKDEFIGLASHELKTPVTSIKGYLQIIERNPDDWKRNQPFISKTHQQVNRLATLVSDLLDVSKIETGKLPFHFTNFDFVTLVNDVVELMSHSSTTHHVETNIDPVTLSVTADRQRIEQVIINIIGNAIKYSPKADKVIVSLKSTSDSLTLSVQDFGIGIDKSHFESIFSRFYRVEDLAAFMSGLGIGLYISKQIITQHHGKMLVESEQGKGSTFSFVLPLQQLHKNNIEPHKIENHKLINS